jgi:uncharacterized protein YrzB (UPF0473 family)
VIIIIDEAETEEATFKQLVIVSTLKAKKKQAVLFPEEQNSSDIRASLEKQISAFNLQSDPQT